MADISLRVNGSERKVNVSPDTPLLWVLRDSLELTGTKFGCGAGLCGACTVHVDGAAVRSCSTPVSQVAGKNVTTLEGLPALYAQQKGLAQAPALHPLQEAFIDQQAMHCGYCYNGVTIKASELLAQNPRPTDAQIREHMNGHLCRCGTYARIMASIKLASSRMAGGAQ